MAKSYKVKGKLIVSFEVFASSQSKATVMWREMMEAWKKKGYGEYEGVILGSIEEYSLDEIEEE